MSGDDGRSWAIRRFADGHTEPAPIAAGTCGADDGFVWVHVDLRDEGPTAWLNDAAGLSRSVIVALTAVESRPRVETFGEGAFVNLRGPGTTPEDDPDRLVSLRIWTERGRVISVGRRTLGQMDALKGKMSQGKLLDPGDVVVATAVAITSVMDQEIAELGDEVDACEEAIDPDATFTTRRKIAQARAEAIGFRRFVVPQRQALEGLAQIDVGWIEEDDRVHLREAADRYARMAEELEAVRERAALLHEQLTDLRAEQVESRTLVLSVVALVFLPLTFLTGLLGMNVAGIPFAHEPWAFAAVVGTCVAIAAGIIGYFVRAHWFR